MYLSFNLNVALCSIFSWITTEYQVPSSQRNDTYFSLSLCVSRLMSRINTPSSRPQSLSVFQWFYLKYYLYLFLSPFSLETAGIIGCASILLC